jgi:YesN/AraC family two-component response regulator
MISCLTLITRAAIRGGLSENVAFQLGNYYVQSVESATNIAGVYQYSHEIFRDFTERVHKCKLEHGHSRETQQCLAYIETHVREKITLEDLATHLKYNKTYLSTKFSRETGMTLSECILNEKITLAKNLLKNTDKNITSISDELSFGSLSYFASQFRKKTGLSPSAYRNSH